ncbi:MAG: DNA-processing protein DprA [Clostridia bacterium]|nr:DNA-processing protein DprA [Clostridia bacterium]
MYSFEESVLILLNSIEGLYSHKQLELLSLYDSAKDLFDNFSRTKSLACSVVSENLYEKILQKLNQQEINKIVNNLVKDEIKVTTIFSSDYPQKLKDIPDPPTVLYYKGDLTLTKKLSIAVVGSRKCTGYGAKVVDLFVKQLAPHDFIIISGMAFGIDEAAHNAAIEYNAKTIAVMGSGFNHIYPAQHRGLAKIIQKEGLLITEFYPDQKPQPYHFPMRNRIVSGLSDGLLIVEAGQKSGTHTTLNHALDQGKNVYIIPNDIFSFSSSGSNEMIKSLQGSMVTSPKDILDDFGLNPDKPKQTLQFDFNETQIINVLKEGQKHFSELLSQTGLGITELNFKLSTLEINGVVTKSAGNFYRLTMEVI